ncbi:tRNA nucleotidyltransferase, A-adding (EC [Olavius sp. associated proteobacterium Delta 1]|nr:tRNA nucleotidyltransferase, A-adding (EC [Olavius sp. associated proteobacterium Delta 1]
MTPFFGQHAIGCECFLFCSLISNRDDLSTDGPVLSGNVKSFLSIHKDLLQASTVGDINLEDVVQLVVVDVNNWERLDRMASLKNKDDLEISLWDHHTNAGNITANFKCQEPVGATVTLLTRQLKKEGKLLTPIQATLLLAGIYEDTGNLSFPATTAEDTYAAAYLLERKADLKIISTFLRPATVNSKKKSCSKCCKPPGASRSTVIRSVLIKLTSRDMWTALPLWFACIWKSSMWMWLLGSSVIQSGIDVW